MISERVVSVGAGGVETTSGWKNVVGNKYVNVGDMVYVDNGFALVGNQQFSSYVPYVPMVKGDYVIELFYDDGYKYRVRKTSDFSIVGDYVMPEDFSGGNGSFIYADNKLSFISFGSNGDITVITNKVTKILNTGESTGVREYEVFYDNNGSLNIAVAYTGGTGSDQYLRVYRYTDEKLISTDDYTGDIQSFRASEIGKFQQYISGVSTVLDFLNPTLKITVNHYDGSEYSHPFLDDDISIGGNFSASFNTHSSSISFPGLDSAFVGLSFKSIWDTSYSKTFQMNPYPYIQPGSPPDWTIDNDTVPKAIITGEFTYSDDSHTATYNQPFGYYPWAAPLIRYWIFTLVSDFTVPITFLNDVDTTSPDRADNTHYTAGDIANYNIVMMVTFSPEIYALPDDIPVDSYTIQVSSGYKMSVTIDMSGTTGTKYSTTFIDSKGTHYNVSSFLNYQDVGDVRFGCNDDVFWFYSQNLNAMYFYNKLTGLLRVIDDSVDGNSMSRSSQLNLAGAKFKKRASAIFK